MNKLHFPFCKIFFKIEEKDATKKKGERDKNGKEEAKCKKKEIIER